MDTDLKDGTAISDGTSLLVSQNTTASHKRQKKPTAPQVLQRMRPISKRKKFKKSLGPDFLETAELGMQYLRDTYEPKCDICSLTMTVSSSTSVYVSEELLHCNNCDAKAHPSCVNLNEEVAHKTQWQCHNCRICSVCRRNEPNEFLIICFSCSKGYHPKCHTNPIINKPKGHWYCENCCSKGSHCSHQPNGMNDKKITESSEESSHSEDNEAEEPPKGSFRLVVEPEDNSESNDQKQNNSDDFSDDLKDEPSVKEENESEIKPIENENMQISNGIELVKEEIPEENGHGEELKNDNQESVDTNQTDSVSPQKWTVEEVESFIREAGFPTESLIFKEQEIDGRSLLLLRRMDVLTGLSLKLGPALKIYNHISRLQGRETNENSNKC